MTKIKWLSILLLAGFLIVYLEWEKATMLLCTKWNTKILSGNTDTKNVFMHPLVALPFVGQLLLVFAIFQKQPNRKLTIASIVLMGCLVFMCLLAGVLSKNLRIVSSTFPFIVLSWLLIKVGHNTKVSSNL